MKSVTPTKMANMAMAVQLVACFCVLPRSGPAANAPTASASAAAPTRMCLSFILFLCLANNCLNGFVKLAIGATNINPGQDHCEDDNADPDWHANAHGHADTDLPCEKLLVESHQQDEAVIRHKSKRRHNDRVPVAHGNKLKKFRICRNPINSILHLFA